MSLSTDPRPIEQFKIDRSLAKAEADPYANLCVVSTVDSNGLPQSRTLVLRDVDDSLALFINKTSPKWKEFQNGIVIQTYWASIQIQYRIRASTRAIKQDIINESWQLRPDIPKKMDWIYHLKFPQSTKIGSIKDLRNELEKIENTHNLEAAPEAAGLLLLPDQIERLDLNTPDGIHDRKLFKKINSRWSAEQLIP